MGGPLGDRDSFHDAVLRLHCQGTQSKARVHVSELPGLTGSYFSEPSFLLSGILIDSALPVLRGMSPIALEGALTPFLPGGSLLYLLLFP